MELNKTMTDTLNTRDVDSFFSDLRHPLIQGLEKKEKTQQQLKTLFDFGEHPVNAYQN